KIEPFMPGGVRLWGRTTIGVRCVSGARWSIGLPVTVKVFGKALVATRQLAARSSLAPSDVELREVELSRQPGQPLTDISAIDGQMTTRPLRAGQTLLPYHVAFAPTISAGDPVRVQVTGAGFTVLATGSALAAGRDGQPLRVRTDTGKVLVGTLKGRTVEIAL
ncbi:MAG: flagellar basal body P-ring formation chaperone FlgA, partial [Burkholderiaceae bacterium]